MRKKQIISCLCLSLLLTACANVGKGQEEIITSIEETESSTMEKTDKGDIVLAWADMEDEIDVEEYEPSYNPYQTLDVATYITKIDNMYFIADCYHDQIIYHDNLEDTLPYWHVLTDEVHYAHTIASDGTVYLVDDTENNRVLVFEKKEDDKYIHTQTFQDIGQWPHYIQYVEKENCFFAWSSVTGQMYIFKREMDTNHMYLSEIRSIPELYGIYVRSFSIIDDAIYFVSGHGNAKIVKADLQSFSVLEEYEVPAEIAGMVQITKIEDMYYITISTDAEENQDYATIIRTKDLKNLANGEYEDIYDQFVQEEAGTPYYITEIDGTFYMANHRTEENIYSFKVKNGEITDVKVVY